MEPQSGDRTQTKRQPENAEPCTLGALLLEAKLFLRYQQAGLKGFEERGGWGTVNPQTQNPKHETQSSRHANPKP